MRDTVKEEEFGYVEGLNQHGEAGSDHHGQTDYIDDSDDVEDDITWTGQGLLEERHCL